MSDWDSEREYETRLRKVLLLSADAVRDQVADYLRNLASQRSWRDVEQPIKEHTSLIKHLPTQFVDYALDVLVEDEQDLDWTDRQPDKLGIRRILDLFPAAPIQGPFLALLRQHHHEGLRLLHGLTNRATKMWKRSMEAQGVLGTPLTPLPLVLPLPTGAKEFWGDIHVYRWHRRTSTGPSVVVSALMALEMWMEEQLEAGASAGELFARALEGTESVAVLGVCASVSLFNPGACLDAAMPLVCHPRMWRLDVARRGSETSADLPFSTPRTEVFDKLNSERSRRPCRRMDIRALVPLFLFGGEEIRTRFEALCQEFRERPIFEFDEEQASPQMRAELEDLLEHYLPVLEPDCYREVREGPAVFWQYVPPEHLRQGAKQAQAAQAELAGWLSLAQWSRETLKSGTCASGLSVPEAVDRARELHREGDFQQPVNPSFGLDCMRIEAIAQAAAAALVVGSHTLDPERTSWCRGILIEAAMSPRGGPVIEETHYPSDIKVSSGRGLGALVSAGLADDDVRAAVFLLVLDREYQVVEAVFSGLSHAWQADPVLCWNSLYLALTISSVPRRGVVFGQGLTLNQAGRKWLESVIETYARNLEQGVVPDVPDFPGADQWFFVHAIVARAIKDLPTDLLLADEASRSRVVALIDKLIDKTFEQIDHTKDDGSMLLTLEFQWVGFLMEWLASAGLSLTADQEATHVFDRIEATWPERPSLTQGLLRGFLKFRIGSMELPAASSLAGWQRICAWVIDSPEVLELGQHTSYPSDLDESVALIVFVEFGKYWFIPEWAHAPLFEALIDRWVTFVGTNHSAYSALLTMLLGTGDRFEAECVLGWLTGVAERSDDARALWLAHRNGERTTEMLARLARKFGTTFRGRSPLMRLIRLVDQLASCGVAHAARLREELERPEQ